MKVSARNVFKGTISKLQPGAVNAEVSLKLPGGNELVAVVTMESVKSLGLAVGKEAVALVKAPWVMLMTESSDIRLSARNCLEGKVTSVTDGAVTLKWSSRLKAAVTSIRLLPVRLSPNWDWRRALALQQ